MVVCLSHDHVHWTPGSLAWAEPGKSAPQPCRAPVPHCPRTGLTSQQEAAKDPRVPVVLAHLPTDPIAGRGVGRGQRGWGAGQGGEPRGRTHSLRKVLTAKAAPWGATCSVVASTRWPCSCRERQAEPTAASSQVPANWGRGARGGTEPLQGTGASEPPPLHLLHMPYPLSVKASLGLDRGDEGRGSRRLLNPAAQRARCQQHSPEDGVPREHHGGCREARGGAGLQQQVRGRSPMAPSPPPLWPRSPPGPALPARASRHGSDPGPS